MTGAPIEGHPLPGVRAAMDATRRAHALLNEHYFTQLRSACLVWDVALVQEGADAVHHAGGPGYRFIEINSASGPQYQLVSRPWLADAAMRAVFPPPPCCGGSYSRTGIPGDFT